MCVLVRVQDEQADELWISRVAEIRVNGHVELLPGDRRDPARLGLAAIRLNVGPTLRLGLVNF